MADTTQKVPASIEPKDASGADVSLVNFPTALTGIVFAVDGDATATQVSPTVYTITKPTPGNVNLTVTAVNVLGATLTEAAVVVFTAPVPVVVSLNITQGTPVAA